MEEKKNNRDKWLHVRVNADELKTINDGFAKTMDDGLSTYIRKIILGKPHIGRYRNQSQDALVNELAKVRMELNSAGNNLNQAVKKLHTLKITDEIKGWLISWELDKKSFYKSLEAVNSAIAKIADQW